MNRPSFGIKRNSSTFLFLFFFSFACIKNYPRQDKLTSHRYKLDSVDLALQHQEQTQLNIHTCTIQRCYCKRDCLHRHLGIRIRLNLRIVKVKRKILQRFSTAQLLKIPPKKTSRKSLGEQ